MTRSSSLAEPPSAKPSSAGFVMSLIVSLLAPLFLGITGGDVGLARMAAAETLEEYRLRTELDSIAVAQIVLNGLAALDSLSRSLMDDLPLTMVLRLRCNGLGLNRAVEQNRRVRRGGGQVEAMSFLTVAVSEPVAAVRRAASVEPAEPEILAAEPSPVEAAVHEEPAQAEQAASVVIPAPTADPGQRRMRVMAMVNEVADLKASLRTLPPDDHAAVNIQIAALDSMMHAMLAGPKAADRTGGEIRASG